MTTKLNVAHAARVLYGLMGAENKSPLVQRVRQVPGIQIERFTDELLFLDFFAIAFSLKFTHSLTWKANGEQIFEALFGMMVGLLGGFWEERGVGTKKEAGQLLLSRISCYFDKVNQSDADNEDMEGFMGSIGATFAMYAMTDETFCDSDGRASSAMWPEVLRRLRMYGDEVISAGIDAFNQRGKMLVGLFESYVIE